VRFRTRVAMMCCSVLQFVVVFCSVLHHRVAMVRSCMAHLESHAICRDSRANETLHA